MKMIRKITAMVAVLAMVIAMLTPFSGKVSKADNIDSTLTLALNGTWTEEQWITETIGERYYKIEIPSDGCFELKVMSYMEKMGGWRYGLEYKLYDQDLSNSMFGGSVYGTETAPTTDTVTRVFSAGIYILKVWGGSGCTGKFKLSATHTSYGVNDQDARSYDSPQNYSLNTQIIGAITETDGEDWYKITIPSTARYIINMKSYMVKYGGWRYSERYILYNQDLSKKILEENIWGTETAPSTQKHDMVLDKGNYYLKICGDSGCTGKYAFSIEKLTQSNCPHDYEKTWHDATYFQRGYNYYHCKKCGHSYKGDYKAVKKLGQAYISYYSSVGKGKIKLSWGTVSDASGYQIRYSRKGNMKNSKTISVKGQSKSKKAIKKLSRRKKYYVQVRAYKKSGSKKVYGKWSQKKSFRTK